MPLNLGSQGKSKSSANGVETIIVFQGMEMVLGQIILEEKIKKVEGKAGKTIIYFYNNFMTISPDTISVPSSQGSSDLQPSVHITHLEVYNLYNLSVLFFH